MNRIRINLTIAPATDETLEQLAAQLGHSKSAVIDLAVAAYAGQQQRGIYIQACMPAMADVLSGQCPRPVELPDGSDIDRHVETPDGDVFWPDVAPAWRTLGLGNVDDICTVARSNRKPKETFCQHVHQTVIELRGFLGEQGAAICTHGRILVFNADGTRVAVAEK